MTHDAHATDLLDRLHGLGRDEPPFATPLATMIPTAVTRGRRRRIASLASRTVAVGVLVGLVGVTVGTLRPGGGLREDLDVTQLGGATSHSSAPSILSSSPAHPVSPAPSYTGPVTGPIEMPRFGCSAEDLTAEAAYSGQDMNQPYTLVRVTNRSQTPCELHGYPEIAISASLAFGHAPLVRAEVDLTRGSIYQVADPGSHASTLEPGGDAWFAVGTGLAYDGPLCTIAELSLAAPGGGDVVVSGFQQQLNGPTGKPLPITVTAYALGAPPSQQ